VLSAQESAAQQDDIIATLARDLEAARYAANRAWKQYDASDPDNRLVASELERRIDQQRLRTFRRWPPTWKRCGLTPKRMCV
jgi:hypothetical protein